MKTAPRPNRRGVKIRYPKTRKPKIPPVVQQPAHTTGLPPLSFSVPNFSDGRPITYTLTPAGYRYQVGSDEAVQTEALTYPQAAAIARRKYAVPAIGCAQTSQGLL